MRYVLLFLLLATPLYAQGISMGGHYSAEGEHPRVFWTLEARSPAVGPIQLAITHSALKEGDSRPPLDRTDITLLAEPDWPVAPVLVGGLEASRAWIGGKDPGPCGTGHDGLQPCLQEWHTGGVLGIGLRARVKGSRIDVRYLRHPGADTAKGALLFLIGLDL